MSDIKNKLSDLLENTGDMALKRRARKVIEKLNPQPKDKILEVGCGDGYYLHLLSSLEISDMSLTGVDIDKDALKSAKNNFKGKKIKLLYADVEDKLPFSANSFDKVVVSEVCEHLKDDVKGLREIKRVLKKGGTCIVTVPNHRYPLLWDPVNWILEKLTGKHIEKGFFAGLWNQHKRLYTPKQIEKAVKKSGFSLKHKEAITWWCLPFNHYIVNLTARMIHSGKLSSQMKAAVNKYETKAKRPMFLDLAFSLVNMVDKLNDIIPIRNSGVGIFVLSEKP
jgi:ubiquinone/menaquinone biosynthesis C-methylase UbiE